MLLYYIATLSFYSQKKMTTQAPLNFFLQNYQLKATCQNLTISLRAFIFKISLRSDLADTALTLDLNLTPTVLYSDVSINKWQVFDSKIGMQWNVTQKWDKSKELEFFLLPSSPQHKNLGSKVIHLYVSMKILRKRSLW